MTEDPSAGNRSVGREIVVGGLIIALGLGAIAALVGGVAQVYVVRWIDSGVKELGFAGFWVPVVGYALLTFVGAVLAVMLIVSVARKKWREAIWGGLARFTRDTWPVRSARCRRDVADADAAGYRRRSDEVAAQRRALGKPTWHVRQYDSSASATNQHWLTNRGHPVSEVALTADPEFFHFDGEARFPGRMQRNNTVPFRGKATERGAVEGVWFHVTWIDENSDEGESDFEFPPEDVQEGRDQGLEQARFKGILEGRQLERDEAAARHGQPVPAPELPPPSPRWVLYNVGSTPAGVTSFELVNKMPRSVAKHVRFDAVHPDEFHFDDAAFWDDLSGEASGAFVGWPVHDGRSFGIALKLTWRDHEGAEQEQLFPVTPGETVHDEEAEF